MRKLEHFLMISLFLFCIMNPQFVQSEMTDDKTVLVSQNIKSVGEFLKHQDYYENISKLCHEDSCFSIDIHDLSRSISVMEEKVLDQIKLEFGEEKALEAKLKGFSITKILMR